MRSTTDFVQVILVSPGGTHLEVCETVAQASVRCYLEYFGDEMSWAAWLDGPFAKSVRRCKPAHIERAASEGAYVMDGPEGLQVAAYPPYRYSGLPSMARKGQVAGMDRPDRPVFPGMDEHQPAVMLNGDISMTTGKAAAAAAHALFAHVLADDLTADDLAGVPVRLVSGLPFGWMSSICPVVIRDNGLTEVEPGTVTALFWPGVRS